jgi:hypothetical protein
MGICGASKSGSSSAPSSSNRLALYSGKSSTLQEGLQSPSMQATNLLGLYVVIKRALMSKYPRIAFTGVPSGDKSESGIP